MTHKSPEPRTALFTGSFNPFTIGHLSIVERALNICDCVVVGVGVNISKTDPASVNERLRAIRNAVAHLGGRVRVVTFSGLAVEAARENGASFLLRGVRSGADYEYERNMADINRRIGHGIETVLMFALPELGAVSSSMVRELRAFGCDVSEFLPAATAEGSQPATK